MINKNHRKIIVLILLLFSIFMMISSASAQDIILNNTVNFKNNIQDAPEGANIILNVSSSPEFSLNSTNVNINIAKSTTIRSSNQSRNAIINLNGHGGAFTIITADSNLRLTLINITIINGNATNGGAIFNANARVDLTGCSFINNTATDGGGGAIFNGGNLNLTGCTFTNNKATIEGGAIYNPSATMLGVSFISNLTAINCTFTNNSAIHGGAIYNNASVNLTGCTFRNNTANVGGAIYIASGNGNVSYSSFVDNGNNAQIYLASGSMVANYNWWGSNNPESSYNSGVTVNNYYVMSISTSVANQTRSVGQNLVFNYNFVLNGTNNNADAASKFSPFTVDIIVNGALWQRINGRDTSQYNLVLNNVDTIIMATLDYASSIVSYKALIDSQGGNDTPGGNNFSEVDISKLTTFLIIDNLKPLFNKANSVKVTLWNSVGELLANKQVSLWVNGEPVATAITNRVGVAKFRYVFKTRKVHKLVVRFDGGTNNIGTDSKTLFLTAKDKTTTKLAKFSPKFNKGATLRVTLKNHRNKAMINKTVKFYANKKCLGQARTNSKGIATLTRIIKVKGSVNFIARYKGDKTFHDSSHTRKIMVKK
ncbi:MAG: hypothetical protein FWE58_01710 [Methanobrevibacter sp.]|nr:hypothetical protein [Methanobrevibacter sp.]